LAGALIPRVGVVSGDVAGAGTVPGTKNVYGCISRTIFKTGTVSGGSPSAVIPGAG